MCCWSKPTSPSSGTRWRRPLLRHRSQGRSAQEQAEVMAGVTSRTSSGPRGAFTAMGAWPGAHGAPIPLGPRWHLRRKPVPGPLWQPPPSEGSTAQHSHWPEALGGGHEYCGRLSPLCHPTGVCAGADWYHSGKLNDPDLKWSSVDALSQGLYITAVLPRKVALHSLSLPQLSSLLVPRPMRFSPWETRCLCAGNFCGR
jgi:hypothetical protein